MKEIKYFKDRVCLNVLTNSLENAKEIYQIADGCVLLGLLSKNYSSVESAIDDMKKYQLELNNSISIGLGAGDSRQWKMVAQISKIIQPLHINQVFPAVGYTRGLIGNDFTNINCLVAPSGVVGKVRINTGPISSMYPDVLVDIESAIAIIKDMGGNSIKFFPMEGLKTIDEYRAVVNACAKMDFIIEPTGGIDLDNFGEIVQIALDAGVKKIIPHVYSSIIDPTTKLTRIVDIKKLMQILKEVVK